MLDPFGVDAGQDRTGNLPSLPSIFPDYPAPLVRNGEARARDSSLGQPAQANESEVACDLFGFLTYEPNADQDHDVGFAGAKRAAPDPSGTSATDPLGSCLGSKLGFRVAVDTRYFQNPKD